MTAAPVRCTAPHPSRPGELCNARLVDAYPDAFSVREGTASPPSRKCFSIKCPKCHAPYVLCLAA